MNKIYFIFLLILTSTILNAQSQKDYLKAYTDKGNSIIGFQTSGQVRGRFNSRITNVESSLMPSISYQYNIINRLSIGGSLGTDLRMRYSGGSRETMDFRAPSVNTKIVVQYYPFKSNGIFIEYALVRNFYFTRGRIIQNMHAEISPGYTFMVGKNKNIAVDLKVNILYKNGTFFLMSNTAVGVKTPLMIAKKKQGI